MVQIAINVKEGYILRVMCFIMLLQERRQALTEQALNQLNIVTDFWKAAAQGKIALKAMMDNSAIELLQVLCHSRIRMIACW